jgi:rSAM/selenodomain-associated transferase 1
MKQLLIVFIKDSKKHPVKTRLAESIGKKKSIWVYNTLLNKTAQVINNLLLDIATFNYISIPKTHPLKSCSKWDKLQSGINLGEKMSNAFNWGFEKGYNHIVLIGSDLWDLNEELIKRAFTELKKKQIVIGPSEDGGYYLIGIKKKIPFIFKDIDWGTNLVFKQSKNKLNKNKLFLLETLNDIDTYDDLKKNKKLMCLYNEKFGQKN